MSAMKNYLHDQICTIADETGQDEVYLMDAYFEICEFTKNEEEALAFLWECAVFNDFTPVLLHTIRKSFRRIRKNALRAGAGLATGLALAITSATAINASAATPDRMPVNAIYAASPEALAGIYPQALVVVDVEENPGTFTAQAMNAFEAGYDGLYWSVDSYPIDDIEPGDIIAAIMDGNGTEDIRDDSILSWHCAGSVSCLF